MKNIVVNDNERRILVVSETREGKVHDYRMFKESEIPRGIPDSVECGLTMVFMECRLTFLI